MSLKTIMVALLPHDDPEPPAFLRPALNLAEANRAYVAAVVGAHRIKIGFAVPYAPVVGHVSEENKRRVAAATTLADAVLAAGKRRQLSISRHVLDGSFDDMVLGFAVQARLHDLVVAAAPGDDEMFGGSLAAALLFESGRPVLFMPPGFSGPLDPGTVVIAWDGSPRAARAVGDAMAFIEAAAKVSIVCVTGDKDLSRAAPGGDLAERLARHNRNVTITEQPLADGDAGDAILRHAQAVDAGLIVMGAYAHARWRQLVLGGATRTVLRTTTRPILMAH